MGFSDLQNAVFWLIAILALALLGLGWGAAALPLDYETRTLLPALHMSLGLTAGALILVQLLLGFLGLAFARGAEPRSWRTTARSVIRQSIYVIVAILAASGAGQTALSGTPLVFWGAALPDFLTPDPDLAATLENVHRLAAYLSAAALAAYGLLAIAGLVASSGGSTALVAQEAAPVPTGAAAIAQPLSKRLRLTGWAVFWIQFVLAFFSAPLLLFGLAGRQISPDVHTIWHAIHWGFAGLGLLILALMLSLYYTRAARMIAGAPGAYLGETPSMAFGFLGASVVVNVLGVLVSFVGVFLSVVLLVGKTVSQPPGIAITDPNKIIRALDVFVLLVNINLLFANFIGAAAAAWLSNQALRARHRFAGIKDDD